MANRLTYYRLVNFASPYVTWFFCHKKFIFFSTINYRWGNYRKLSSSTWRELRFTCKSH